MLTVKNVIDGINGYHCDNDTLIKRYVECNGHMYRDYCRVGELEDVMYYGPDEGDREDWTDEWLDAEVDVIHFDTKNKQLIRQINLV